jgi:hypothetical protein
MNTNELVSRRSSKSDLARIDAHEARQEKQEELPDLTDEMLPSRRSKRATYRVVTKMLIRARPGLAIERTSSAHV